MLVRVGCSKWWPGSLTGVVFSAARKKGMFGLAGSGSVISQAVKPSIFSLHYGSSFLPVRGHIALLFSECWPLQ